MIKNNHDRPIEDFADDIKRLRKAGFNPIGVTQMYFEDTYVFETKKEAKKAYNYFENRDKRQCSQKEVIIGWWYGKQDFLKEAKKYNDEADGFSKLLVYWLKETDREQLIKDLEGVSDNVETIDDDSDTVKQIKTDLFRILNQIKALQV
ncbi:MAG: hypothetical protein ACOCVF_00920 [bacterium]